MKQTRIEQDRTVRESEPQEVISGTPARESCAGVETMWRRSPDGFGRIVITLPGHLPDFGASTDVVAAESVETIGLAKFSEGESVGCRKAYYEESCILKNLLESGADVIQVRKPNWSDVELRDFLKELTSVCGGDLSRFTLHGHRDLAVRFGLGGLHVPIGEGRQGWCGRLSASCHTLEQGYNCSPDFDYVFLSPIFDSISKTGYRSAFDLQSLQEFFSVGREQRPEVVALGGVSANNLTAVMRVGFSGAAFLGALWCERSRGGESLPYPGSSGVIGLAKNRPGSVFSENVELDPISRSMAGIESAPVHALVASDECRAADIPVAEIEPTSIYAQDVLGRFVRLTQCKRIAPLQYITRGTDAAAILAEVRSFLTGGGRWVQLRMKGARTEEIVRVGRRVAELCRVAGAVFLVNDDPAVALAVGADGVHVGCEDTPVSEARRLLGPQAIVGATANNFSDIQRAAAQGADYIGLGPYRFTTTKKKLSPVLGLDGYRRIFAMCQEQGLDLPVVAIGAVACADVPPLLEIGAWGVAVSGAIGATVDPAEATRTFLHKLSTSGSFLRPDGSVNESTFGRTDCTSSLTSFTTPKGFK